MTHRHAHAEKVARMVREHWGCEVRREVAL
jgi:hypothetical protein